MNTHELILADGKRVTVNPALVTCFHEAEEGTYIVFMGGGSVTVAESYDSVTELFNPEQQAGR
jgi:hypothetical protein